MKTILHWKKGPFNSTCTIYSAEGAIGHLRENNWKQTAEGEINKRKYHFRTRGYFNQVCEIFAPDTNYNIGKIEYNTLKNRAEITYLGQSFHWKYDNFWQTRWSISDDRDLSIIFQGGTGKGTIEGADLTEFLALTGLFVRNYYVQSIIIIFVAIFVPIIASLSH